MARGLGRGHGMLAGDAAPPACRARGRPHSPPSGSPSAVRSSPKTSAAPCST
jgi:hypothetical protein